LVFSLIRLARPHQWSKSFFVLLGPLYGLKDLAKRGEGVETLILGLFAAAAFALASSASYIINDLLDADQDRVHPRKRHRPIASGAVSKTQAKWFAAALGLGAVGLLLMLRSDVRLAVTLVVGVYVANVWAYSLWLKHIVIADVMSLSLGFVLRMLGGCAAVAIAPTSWLLNCTFFIAMFLAFGKRLGERRTMGLDAASARGVQAAYTDELLRMAVVVTGVATLITYAGYVQFRELENTHIVPPFHAGINLLWFTMVPATYALLRSIVLLERGSYDDPTELVVHDWPMKIAAGTFALLSIAVLTWNLWAPW
jgi:decaprenyl-phosphate phosphoribosyltransferase